MSTLYSYVSCFFGFLGRLFRNVLFQLLSFVILIGVVSISYGAWTTLNREDVTSGKKITSTLMQGIIDNINGLTSVINVKDGNVGIGTTNPELKLHIKSGNVFLDRQDNISKDLDFYSTYKGQNNIQAGTFGYGVRPFNDAWQIWQKEVDTVPSSNSGWINLFHVSKGGNVGIGTASPSQKLHVIGNVLASSYLTPSDLTLKKEIKQTKGIETIKKLKGVEFKWKKNNKKDLGVIAQEVEQVLPELVTTNKETNKKSINYIGLIAPLIEAVKEQQKEIEKQEEETRKQKATIEKLEKENKSYKTRLDTLEKRMQSLEGSQK